MKDVSTYLQQLKEIGDKAEGAPWSFGTYCSVRDGYYKLIKMNGVLVNAARGVAHNEAPVENTGMVSKEIARAALKEVEEIIQK